MTNKINVLEIGSSVAGSIVVEHHYLHRRPPISHAFGLISESIIVGVCTFGLPAAHQLRLSACPTDPSKVIELNRLWVCDSMPRNTESWFVTRCLKLLPPLIIVSYADSAVGHSGYIYRALNFHFAGMTDEECKTPRCDYVMDVADVETLFGTVPGKAKHSRSSFRDYSADVVHATAKRVPRSTKWKYWTVTGNRRQRRALIAICGWPSRPIMKADKLGRRDD